MSDTTRRAVLAGAAGVTAVTVLAACGDDSDNGSDTPAGNSTGNQTGGGATTGGAAAGLATKADIPVGGGKIFKDGGGVVITQPVSGTFKAFSSVCTHQNCAVSEVAGGNIICKCHNSTFSVQDGSVTNGPATKPLPEKTLKIDGDSISLG